MRAALLLLHFSFAEVILFWRPLSLADILITVVGPLSCLASHTVCFLSLQSEVGEKGAHQKEKYVFMSDGEVSVLLHLSRWWCSYVSLL